MKLTVLLLSQLLLGLQLTVLTPPAEAASQDTWYPLDVQVSEPPFNKERKRVTRSYEPLPQSAQRWHFCVLIPHLKDAYWLGVNYGLVNQARSVGVDLTIYEAGGYERLDVQREQFDECLQRSEKPVDGLIVSAISATGLNDKISAARAANLPVVDLINGLESDEISARSAVDYYDTAFQAGQYLKSLVPAEGEPLGVAWFPGPEGPTWTAAGDQGLREALAGSRFKIVVSKWGDTGKTTQARLIESALDDVDVSLIDYVVGTTVSAEAAQSILRKRGLSDSIGVMAYYYGPGVHRGISRGTIIAAPTDMPVIQARIAVDILTRILEQEPYFHHVAPSIELINQSNIKDWDVATTLAPRGFRPVFSVDD